MVLRMKEVTEATSVELYEWDEPSELAFLLDWELDWDASEASVRFIGTEANIFSTMWTWLLRELRMDRFRSCSREGKMALLRSWRRTMITCLIEWLQSLEILRFCCSYQHKRCFVFNANKTKHLSRHGVLRRLWFCDPELTQSHWNIHGLIVRMIALSNKTFEIYYHFLSGFLPVFDCVFHAGAP